MPAPAQSFQVATDSPERVRREVESLLSRIGRPAGGLVFLSGELGERLGSVGEAVRDVAGDTPLLLISAAGVLSEQGQIEGQSAAAAIAWAGGRTEAFTVAAQSADELGEALALGLADRVSRASAPAIVFARPEGFGPSTLDPLGAVRGLSNVLGAGAVGPVAAIERGQLQSGAAVGLVVRGLSAPIIKSSPACRLISPLRLVTETRGALVTKIEGEPALDVLTAAGEELSGEPLVFAVIAEPDDDPPELVVRGITGVDPMRRGLVISDEIRDGMLLAFGVRDATAARADLEASLRDAQRHLAGAAPRFALFLSCAGRGSGLYGVPDVEPHMVRARFPDVPFAGMLSAFEIAPRRMRPRLMLYTGVLALFTAPS